MLREEGSEFTMYGAQPWQAQLASSGKIAGAKQSAPRPGIGALHRWRRSCGRQPTLFGCRVSTFGDRVAF